MFEGGRFNGVSHAGGGGRFAGRGGLVILGFTSSPLAPPPKGDISGVFFVY
jgi:hypothetical protein